MTEKNPDRPEEPFVPETSEDTGSDKDITADVEPEPECKTGFTVAFHDDEKLHIHARRWAHTGVNHEFFANPDATVSNQRPMATANAECVKYVLDNEAQYAGCAATKN